MTPLTTADVAHAAPRASTVLSGVRAVWDGAAVAGPAYPCACTPGDNLALHLALTRAPAGSILVCDAGGDVTCAYAGELIALDARSRGLAGLVVTGAVRDTRELETLAFPVFAAGTCPLSPAKHAAGSVGQELSIGGAAVEVGDLIVGDRDGVLVVRGVDATALESAVSALREREREIRAALERGEPLARQLGIDVI